MSQVPGAPSAPPAGSGGPPPGEWPTGRWPRGSRARALTGVTAVVVVGGVAAVLASMAGSGSAKAPSGAPPVAARTTTAPRTTGSARPSVPAPPSSSAGVARRTAVSSPHRVAGTTAPTTAGRTVVTAAGPAATGTSPLAPSVTAGTAVPWSPTSPNTLVGDNGNPAHWPAAQSKPPSLAGAYSDNIMTAFITLVRYQDWVWSHPNPSFVKRYMQPGTALYKLELSRIEQLQSHHLHADASPTDIDWLGITLPPRRLITSSVQGHPMFSPAALNVVINQRVGVLLNHRGVAVMRSPGGGKAAFSEVLVEGRDGRWRLADIHLLRLSHGLGSVAR